jgi:hypothetical protein
MLWVCRGFYSLMRHQVRVGVCAMVWSCASSCAPQWLRQCSLHFDPL